MSRARERGVAVLEFAVIAPAVLALIVALIETMIQVSAQSALEYGARRASRFGATGAAAPAYAASPPASRGAAIADVVARSSGGLIDKTRLSIVVTSYASFADAGADAGAGAGPTAGPGASGGVVRYELDYLQPFLTRLAATLAGRPGLSHRVVFFVQNEPFPAS